MNTTSNITIQKIDTAAPFTASMKYLGQLRVEATHLKSGASILTDAPTDNHGKGAAFSPTDMVATAVGSCLLTIMGIKARQLDLDIEGMEASIRKKMLSTPRRIAQVEVLIRFDGNKLSDANKQALEACANNCPVCNSLSAALDIRIYFDWQ